MGTEYIEIWQSEYLSTPALKKSILLEYLNPLKYCNIKIQYLTNYYIVDYSKIELSQHFKARVLKYSSPSASEHSILLALNTQIHK